MGRTSSNSLLNSLKGKIWLATSGQAFFICVFGLISYLIVSHLTDDPFYVVFIPFLFLSFAMMVFGWWLANEVVIPIEKATLLAKSLERSPTASLPKTLGSSEADELLRTLHRNSQQMHKILNLMDEVAGGNVNVALTPLQNSDRLTNSFQQLLAKVAESIHAKQDLEKLEKAINQISLEIYQVRNGNLNVEVSEDFPQTKEITETLRYLIHHLDEITALVKRETSQTKDSAAGFQRTIAEVVERDETRIQEMNRAAITLKKVPNGIQKISENLADSASSASRSIEKARQGSRSAQANSAAVSQLRKQIQEAIKQIQKLGERSQEIDKIAKTIGDLAHRTNMIALNASIYTGESAAENSGDLIAVIAEEIERLAARAAGMNKSISEFNKSIASEINQAESVLQQSVGETANLSKFAIETGNALDELEKYVNQFLSLQNKLVVSAHEQTFETDQAFQTFAAFISETEEEIENLRNSQANVTQITRAFENLQSAAADFKNAETSSNAADSDEEIYSGVTSPRFIA
jgi:methyl-accepting chemotaxis protein